MLSGGDSGATVAGNGRGGSQGGAGRLWARRRPRRRDVEPFTKVAAGDDDLGSAASSPSSRRRGRAGKP
jgi:hypothetical protein